ncbi:cholesin isoform X2 [Bombus flavifrons]|uniref:cholesin isoform X2 n=1 Tax=Bombus flavifrons TaxID=103934 RepID=UPI0037037794
MGLESTSKFKVISSKSGKRMKKNYKSGDKIDNNVDTSACDTNQVENVNKQDMKRKRQNEKRRNNINDNIDKNIIKDDKEENVYTEVQENQDVEDTKSDEESSPKKKAHIDTTNGLNDTEVIYKKHPRKPSKRQLKKQKAEQRKNERRMASRIEAMTKGLSYVSKWKYARSEWKFEKIRQIWLIDNLLDETYIPDDIFPIVLEYFEGCKGMARELLLRKGLDVVRKVENEENKDEVESIAYQRARKLLQALPTET